MGLPPVALVRVEVEEVGFPPVALVRVEVLLLLSVADERSLPDAVDVVLPVTSSSGPAYVPLSKLPFPPASS